jgi:hypothetical protein
MNTDFDLEKIRVHPCPIVVGWVGTGERGDSRQTFARAHPSYSRSRSK